MRKYFIYVLVFIILNLVQANNKIKFKKCEDNINYEIDIKEINTKNELKFQKNKKYKFNVKFTKKININKLIDKELNIKVKYVNFNISFERNIKIVDKKKIRIINNDTIRFEIEVPKFALIGEYLITTSIIKDQKKYSCINFEIKIEK